MKLSEQDGPVGVTPEARAWLDGCVAWCDTRRKGEAEHPATMVIEFGPNGQRVQIAQCTRHGEAELFTSSLLGTVERVQP